MARPVFYKTDKERKKAVEKNKHRHNILNKRCREFVKARHPEIYRFFKELKDIDL